MKKIFLAVLAISTIALTSCSNDSKDDTTATGNGSLKLEFDNVYGAADLALNTEYTNSNGEKVKPNNVIYIISNVVLTKADGSTYTVPKSSSYFFVNETDEASTLITLPNIPAGDYTKVKFGIGVDQAQYDAGADGQGDLWTTAALPSLGMTWSWASGYKFVKFEGTVTSTTHTDAPYKVHTGKTGSIYNYAEATLDFPNNALVRTNITPQVHIMADVKKIIDGTTVINFEEGLDVMGGTKVQQIMANNVPTMFEAHHVHND
ncbi:MbnP family protein [Flavobacterium lotistagni]|uniref:MbnP family protein n=1 Tax=Flavobacterium lotistagni TaxID=2709660 RepID=UPI001409E6E4|nr:MbnP family protein [Flavobacterium lotistagni]